MSKSLKDKIEDVELEIKALQTSLAALKKADNTLLIENLKEKINEAILLIEDPAAELDPDFERDYNQEPEHRVGFKWESKTSLTVLKHLLQLLSKDPTSRLVEQMAKSYYISFC